MPSVVLQGQGSQRDHATGVFEENQCCCVRAEGAAAPLLGRAEALAGLGLPLSSSAGAVGVEFFGTLVLYLSLFRGS